MSSPLDPRPDDHVADLASEYVHEQLDAATAERVRAHLRGCAECASQIEFANRLRQQVARAGLRHLPADRLLTLAENATAPIFTDEQQHLQQCALCREQLTWARELPALAEGSTAATAEQPAGVTTTAPTAAVSQRRQTADEVIAAARRTAKGRPLRSRRTAGQPSVAERWRRRPRRSAAAGRGGINLPALSWRWVSLAAAAAAVLVFMYPRIHSNIETLSSLARIEPLPVRAQRAAADPESFDGLLERGLSAYQSKDYASAVEALGRAAARDTTDASAQLYLGSAHLQLRQQREAAVALLKATELSDAPAITDAAFWLLANSCLAQQDRSCATVYLREVTHSAGPHTEQAQKLLDHIAQMQQR